MPEPQNWQARVIQFCSGKELKNGHKPQKLASWANSVEVVKS
jgi:hypothetical protein